MTAAASLRNPAIDLVRFVAMTMVLSLHTTHTHYSVLSLSWVTYNISVAAIPLFFLCSGYLLLGRDRAASGPGYAIGKVAACLRVILTVTIAGAGLLMLRSRPAGILDLAGMSIFQKDILGHLWFLWAICIIYLVYPALNRLYLSRYRAFVVLAAVLATIQAVVFAANVTSQFEAGVPQTFRLWNWLSYFAIGGLLRRRPLALPRPVAATCVSGAVMLASMYLIYPLMDIDYCEYYYSSPLTIVFVVCLFSLCTDSKAGSKYDFTVLAGLFLPVYLIHPFVILLADKLFGELYWQVPVVTFVSTYAASLLLAMAACRLRPVRALLSV